MTRHTHTMHTPMPRPRQHGEPRVGGDVARLTGLVMRSGQRLQAQRLVGTALYHAALLAGMPPVHLWQHALVRATPLVDLRAMRMGRATRWVPGPVTPRAGRARAMRWMVEAARDRARREGLPMALALARVVVDTARGTGVVATRRADLHRLAEKNRGYSRYRWW